MKRSTFVKTKIAYELQEEWEVKCSLLLSVARFHSCLYQVLLPPTKYFAYIIFHSKQ